jgi:lysophospholipase L1-like esterase
MSKFLYRSYVALGDSLTEGLGDFDFEVSRFGCGWADRLAELFARVAFESGENFDYANLALRGSSLYEILTAQLEDALALEPDFVTIFAGSNDFMRSKKSHPEMRALLRGAVERLHATGAHVLLVNTVNPVHLGLFKPLSHKARDMSALIEDVAAEYQVPVLDLFSMREFENLEFWCEDMVHFSGHGHIRIANRAAQMLGLDQGFEEADPADMKKPDRSPAAVFRWSIEHVLPYLVRRIRRRSSGDGLEPKHDSYVTLISREAIRKAAVARKELQNQSRTALRA